MTARNKTKHYDTLTVEQKKMYDETLAKQLNNGAVSPLEPNCCDDTTISLAISAKRQADALERIADILARQNDIAAQLSDELRG